MLKARMRLLQAVAVAATLAFHCLPAQAHPHVWIKMEATLLYQGGAFVGLAHKWSFDELYTAMAIEGLDQNKDGKYDRTELAELAKVNVDALKDFNYFTFPALAGQVLKLGEARDYWLEHKDGILSLHFTVPFENPVLTEAKGLAFSVYDPSFFIAFELAKTEHPVRLGEGAPKECRLKIGVPEQRETSVLGEALSALGGVVSLNKTVAVVCGQDDDGAAAVAALNPASKEPKAPPAKTALAEPRSAETKVPPVAAEWAGPLQMAAAAQDAMKAAVSRLKTAEPFSAALLLAAISFAYGVLHAVGPGHGKAVISSYVLADGQTVRRGVLLSFLAALIQALSALALVAILLLVFGAVGLRRASVEAWLEATSWGLVALVGAWLLYHQLRIVYAPAHAHGAGHHHHGHHHHGHHHHHDACEVCAHLPAPSQLQGDWSWRRALSLAFAVGIRPCTGAVLVLVFAIGQGLWWAGVFSTLAMALGTAITVSVLAALAVGFREATARIAGSRSSKWGARVQLAAGFCGAALVLIMGVVFFIGSLGSFRPL